MNSFRSTERGALLIVGGAGYVGARLVPQLLKDGYDVTVVDLLWFGNPFDTSVRLVQKDALHLTAQDLRGYEQVIFLAGLSNDPMAELSPSFNYVHNTVVPAHLAHVAKKAGVRRFVYAESCSVYGFDDTIVFDENSAPKTVTLYGTSKLFGGIAAETIADETFSVMRLRKGTICGSSPRMRFDLLVNTMFKNAMTTGEITVNNPSIWRPVLSMSDTVEAYRLALRSPLSVGGIFNISSENATVGEVGEQVHDFFEKRGAPIRLTVKQDAEKRNYRVSTEKARRELGYAPAGSVASILEELATNFDRSHDYHNERYYNIRVFEKLLNVKPDSEGGIRSVRFDEKASTGASTDTTAA